MKLSRVWLGALCIWAVSGLSAQSPKFERLYPLRPEEGVFAYARISPDGRYLVYASIAKDPQQVRGVPMTVVLVDLADRRVLFTERGLDAYWSPDGERMIYSSNTTGTVSIRHLRSGDITRNVAPMALGDYHSWGLRDGKNLILTIQSNYYYLDGDQGVMPAQKVPPCEGIGVGERPLLSRDGKRITTFVRGTVVVRGLTDCKDIFDTGIQGAKADFSADGRYIAFHVPKPVGTGYDIDIIDLKDRSVRMLTLAGSVLFPSWTDDGRLCFRYDGDDYRGFMMATNILSLPAHPLSSTADHVPAQRMWLDLFPETALPRHKLNVVMVWATWSAHSPVALRDLQQAQQYWNRHAVDVGVMTATDPASRQPDIDRLMSDNKVKLSRIPLSGQRLKLTEAQNQMPTTLLFRDGRLVDRRLGAQSFEQLQAWIAGVNAVQQ